MATDDKSLFLAPAESPSLIKDGPLFDLSALSAVQTVFEPSDGIVDPWGRQLSGSFANIFIYAERVRFSLPVASSDASGLLNILQPTLIHDLAKIESDLLSPVTYSTSEQLLPNDENLNIALRNFETFARINRTKMKDFCRLHSTKFITEFQRIRIRHGLTHDIARLAEVESVKKLAQYIGVPVEMIIYAFDLTLRYPMYVKLAGEGNFYLNHQIRDPFCISNENMRVEPAVQPPLPISFAPAIRAMVPKLTREEYLTIIKILREKVRETAIINLKAGDVPKDLIQEIASSAKLRPRFRAEHQVWDYVAFVLGAAVGGAAWLATGAPVAGVFGAATGRAVYLTTTGWRRHGNAPLLPAKAGEFSCLRWAVKWDIEEQARDEKK